jgi:hypothetical protein
MSTSNPTPFGVALLAPTARLTNAKTVSLDAGSAPAFSALPTPKIWSCDGLRFRGRNHPSLLRSAGLALRASDIAE